MNAKLITAALAGALTLSATNAQADQSPTKEGLAAVTKTEFSPYAGRNFPTRVLWGDTHLHTAVSVDAGTMCRIGQEDGFRFARGEEMLQWEYAREALKTGLTLEKKLGVNPYKFGMIGSTDAHTAMAAVEEDNFFGKHSGVEPEPHRWEHVVIAAPDPKFTIKGWQQAAGGYAAVWATENTREAIFDAMKRKETYATTGARMTVRFFGGWDFTPEDTETRLPAGVGYAKGVPMGGDLRKAPAGKKPSFLLAAMKDPYSGNLDRIQIVKGWLDKGGKAQEKVYEVVWSGGRKPGADGKLPLVGNTVDVEKATWKNTIGSPELISTWTDPDFDASLPAFYYARVIEIPTPRWTAYEAKRFGIQMTKDVPMTTQERAYTSPIWYTP